MKQQFVVKKNRDTVSQETKINDQVSTDQHLSMLWFYENIRTSSLCCAHNILTGVFVIQLSSNAGILVGGTVWVTTTNCHYMSDNFEK